MKESLPFTQKDFDEAKVKTERFGLKLNKVEDDVDKVYEDIEYLYDGLENIENHSRRNNIKVFGIPEKNEKKGPELWEECEEVVKSEIESKLNMECGDNVIIERAHLVGKRHAPIRHLPDRTTVKVRPRPIIAKFLSWKDKEKIVKAARKIKPKQVQFLEDFSQRTLDKRKAMVPGVNCSKEKWQKSVFSYGSSRLQTYKTTRRSQSEPWQAKWTVSKTEQDPGPGPGYKIHFL